MIDFNALAQSAIFGMDQSGERVAVLSRALRQLAADVLCEYADALASYSVLSDEKALQRFLVDDIRTRATAIKDGKQ
jgi:hypothetical protein